MFKRNHLGFLGTIYLIVGVIIAVTHHYITTDVIARVASALLAIFLWPLPLLGIDLHIG
jgi:hypothetical protein